MLVILLSGFRFAGKDEVAKIMKDMVKDRNVYIIGFALYPKRKYAEFKSLNLDKLLYDRDYKELHRPGLIEYAMGERVKNPDVWVDALYQDIVNFNSNDIVIVPDYRFPNEYKFLVNKDNLEVKTIRIMANENIRKERGWSFDPKIDKSESEKIPSDVFDYVLCNNTNDISNIQNAICNSLLHKLLRVIPDDILQNA
jgi:phosphomevalonate kinase